MIRADAASLIYQDHGREVAACDEVTLKIAQGEFLGILGPSGSGKSSLLYLLCGLKIPSAGKVEYLGRDLARLTEAELARIRLADFGFVFQVPYLLGYLSALENVNTCFVAAQAQNRAASLLDRLGIGEKSHRFPHELSGGERQRVCIARALANSPKVVFADEPTASLDHRNGEEVVRLLNEARGDGSLVLVTHDPSMLEAADRIVKIVDGRIESIESR